MVAPAAIWLLLLRYLPMGGIILAFKNYKINPRNPSFISNLLSSKWVGFKNFEFLFKTNDAWIMFRNTLGYNIVFIILGVIIPVAFAIMMNEFSRKFVRKTYQTMMFFPYFLSWVVVSYFLNAFLDAQYGMIPAMQAAAGKEVTSWYTTPGPWPYLLVKDTATQNCWDVNGTLLAELGYDVDAVCAAGLDYFSDEFAEMLQKAKDAKGKDFYPLLIEPVVLERMVNHSAIITGDVAAGNVLSYYYDAEHPSNDIGSTIVNKYATDEFAKFAAKTYEYAQKGFISPSCQSTATANDYRVACQSSGEYLFGTQSYAFGYELDASGVRGIDVRMVPETAAYMDCTSGQGAMVAISATSKNPERALMFLNLLNTDSKLMTMLNYGTEGFTYTTNEDGTISFTDARATYSPWTNGMGNVRILPPTAAQGLDYWDRFAAYYDAAEALPYGGFIFDSSELDTESAALANVYAEYAFNLMSGAVDPEAVLPEFLSKLEAAGINGFVAAAQAQLEAYMG